MLLAFSGEPEKSEEFAAIDHPSPDLDWNECGSKEACDARDCGLSGSTERHRRIVVSNIVCELGRHLLRRMRELRYTKAFIGTNHSPVAVIAGFV